MRLRAGNVVGRFLARALEAELEMIESGMHQGFELGFVQWEARSYEADVEASGARAADEVNDVRPRERLAAGEVGLENTSFRSFLEHARPNFRRKFVRARLQLQWI